MQSHQITSTEGFARPPICGGDAARLDFIHRIPGWVLHARPDRPSCDEPAEQPKKVYGARPPRKAEPSPAEPPKRHKAPRAGLRGPGSKPVKRSSEEFEVGHDRVADRRRRIKKRRAELKEDREAEMTEAAKAEGMTLRQWRDKHVDAAKDVIFDHKHEGGREPTDAERRLVKSADYAIYLADKLAGEATRDSSGNFVWPGGMVAGKYRRAAFMKRGLKSGRHSHYKRVAASVGRASKGNLIAGDAKDGMGRMSKKLYALDKPYVFFSAVCVDMWRIDIDRKFKSYEDLRAWISHIVDEHNLPAAPHIASWIPDDDHPGEVHNPHLYILLPEGSAVWKKSPARQHNMLAAVIKALQEAFGGDRGGNAHPYSGKNPLSWLVESRIVEPKRMPTLGEWHEALDCDWVPDGMPSDITIANLHDVAKAVDKESAAWFRVVQGVACSTGHAFYKAGKVDLDDRDAFAKKISRTISGPLTKELKPAAGKQAKDLADLVEGAASYVARTFDPSRIDRQHRNHGAAAHLIEKGMTKLEREQTGGRYATTVRMDKTIEALAEAIRLDMLCGRSPTVADIVAKGIRCANTVKRHFDAAYAIARSRIPAQRASISFQGLFRGNLRFTADTPISVQAGAAVAPLNSTVAEPETTANPDTPNHFAPADPPGTDPADSYEYDLVADVVARLEHGRLHGDPSPSALRGALSSSSGARRRQIRTITSPAGANFASFRAAGIRSHHPAKRAA